MLLPTPHPNVVFQPLDDGAVLFSPDTELYFGLNEVGALVWGLLPPTIRQFADLATAIAVRYPDASPATIEADLLELLEALEREGLVRSAGQGVDVRPSS